MGLWIIGEIPKEFHPFFADEYTFELYSKEKGDEIDGVNYQRGASKLNEALWLWEIFDTKRRKELLEFINNKIVNEENYRDNGHLMSVSQIQHYLNLLNDIDEKARTVTDENGYVLPDKADYVRGKLDELGLIENGTKKTTFLPTTYITPLQLLKQSNLF